MKPGDLIINTIFYSLVTSCIIGTALMVKLNFLDEEKLRGKQTKTHAR